MAPQPNGANTMIVCICKGLSDKALSGVVRSGCDTVAEIGDACGAGTDCGTCHGALEELITEVRIGESGRQARQLRAPCSSSIVA